jgi:hypothetical protein
VSPLVPLSAPLVDAFPLLVELVVSVVFSGDRVGPLRRSCIQKSVMAGNSFTLNLQALVDRCELSEDGQQCVSDESLGHWIGWDDGWPVDMVVDASVVVADTKLLRTRRSVHSGGTRTTLGSERSG